MTAVCLLELSTAMVMLTPPRSSSSGLDPHHISIDEQLSPLKYAAAARFAVDVFFEESNPLFKRMHMDFLANAQRKEMVRRQLERERGGENVLLVAKSGSAVHGSGLVGFVELFPHELNHQLLLDVCPDVFWDTKPDVNGMVVISKIANLAISKSCRRVGLGSALVERCVLQAEEWGHKHVLLYVDEDNTAARKMYERLGFRDVYADRGCKRYVINGAFLRLERTVKLLFVKRINAEE